MAKKFVITNSEGDYWSNEIGWVTDIESAERFTEQEKNGFNLPMEGEWKEPKKIELKEKIPTSPLDIDSERYKGRF